jgi:hypothetical protein
MSEILITKRSGDRVPFSREKLANSLNRAGAGEEMVQEIVREIEQELQHKELSTRNIYQKAFSLMKKKSRHLAARYKLKRAITELGPSGYPFEHFVAELLQYQGYNTKVGVHMEGHCIEHEVDVLAKKNGEIILVECKFRQNNQFKTDVKVPLYIHSRFLDIEKKISLQNDGQVNFWIATNAKFTDDAVRYAHCAGIYLLSWDHPAQGNLKERVELAGLHPVTCLTSLTRNEKESLLEMKVILSRHLLARPETLDAIGLTATRRNRALEEAGILVGESQV